MSKNITYVVRNVTRNTYFVRYDDNNGLIETTNILKAKKYKNFANAIDMAFDLTDVDCVYATAELILKEK